ncbi:MAG: Hsp20/alpha crystallin family protein [Victivallaceae bacterium]|nr:Hsp20/alpha crystallin family protein [Victivallaceae bacterium]
MSKEMMKQDDVCKAVEAEPSIQIMPLVDVLDGPDGVTMWFEVPGANSKSVDIEINEGVMVMTASSSLRRNGRPIMFRRGFQLAEGIDPEKISAKTQDGVLTLNIPKSEKAKVHKIKVC